MVKFIKISSIIILVLLAIVSGFLVVIQNMASLFAIATGILFLYYLLVLSITYIYNNESNNKILLIIICVLFFVPLLWLFIDTEGLINLLMSNVNLDMK